MQGSTLAIASMQILGMNAVTSPEPDLIADSEAMPIAPVMPRQPPISKTWPKLPLWLKGCLSPRAFKQASVFESIGKSLPLSLDQNALLASRIYDLFMF